MRCEKCGDEYDINPLTTALDQEDRSLCPKCRKREYITPYHHLNPSFAPRRLKHIGYRERGDAHLFFGIELEVGDGGENDTIAKKVVNYLNFKSSKSLETSSKNPLYVYCSHDSSIRNGFEIITVPCSIQLHSSKFTDWGETFAMLQGFGYTSAANGTCGMHIHFSRSFMSTDELYRLLLMVVKFSEELQLFARRPYNEYCKALPSDLSSYIGTYNASGRHGGHYYCINITNRNTIEFRMFKGTLNLNVFAETLNLVYTMVTIAKNQNIDEINTMHFEDFLSDNGRRIYKNLKNGMRYNE